MFPLRIAWRYVKARKSHRAVNIIAWIAVGGVAVAVAAMVVVLSIYNGFEQLSAQRMSRMDPQLLVQRTDGRMIENADSLAAALERIAGVEAADPVITERALIMADMGQMPVVFKAVPAGYDRRNIALDSLMEAGAYATQTASGYPAAAVSVGVANKLAVIPEQAPLANIYVPRRVGRINPANPGAAFARESMVVSGVFRTDDQDVDADHIIIPLAVARELLDYDTQGSAVDLRLSPDASAVKVQRAVQDAVGDGISVQNRLEQRSENFRMIAIEKWVTFMMLLMVLVIALFNIVSTLSLLVIEKRDNMSTLRAIGATRHSVGSIFAWQGFIVTVTGGVIGIVLGVALALTQEYGHVITLGSRPGTAVVDYYPVSLLVTDLLIVFAAVLAVSLLMTLVARLLAAKNS